MNLLIKYQDKNTTKTQLIPIEKTGVLSAIDNFLKYDIIYSNNITIKDIKKLEIIYDFSDSKSQTTQRITSIISQVLQCVKNF